MAEIKASLSHILRSLTLPPNVTTPSSMSSSKSTIASYPIKYLTYSEMQQLRDLDLCLNCHEQYTAGHRCQQQRILLILPEDKEVLQAIEPKLEEPQKQDVTIHALPTISDPKALRFEAAVLNSPVITFIDTSTTHHYLHPKTAHFLGLQIDKSSTFYVSVGNEEKIKGKRLCHDDYTLYCMDLNECMIKMGKSKVLIFDPGGVAMFLFDLEDKVIFKGSVMIRIWVGSHKNNDATQHNRPRPVIKLLSRFMNRA